MGDGDGGVKGVKVEERLAGYPGELGYLGEKALGQEQGEARVLHAVLGKAAYPMARFSLLFHVLPFRALSFPEQLLGHPVQSEDLGHEVGGHDVLYEIVKVHVHAARYQGRARAHALLEYQVRAVPAQMRVQLVELRTLCYAQEVVAVRVVACYHVRVALLDYLLEPLEQGLLVLDYLHAWVQALLPGQGLGEARAVAE